jgi:hypothetical protein
MDTKYDLLPDAETVPDVEWDIRREGHAWNGDIARPRRHLAPEKIELIGGQLFCSETERLTLLALLLENVGIDKAIRFGDPNVWREAIADLL